MIILMCNFREVTTETDMTTETKIVNMLTNSKMFF